MRIGELRVERNGKLIERIHLRGTFEERTFLDYLLLHVDLQRIRKGERNAHLRGGASTQKKPGEREFDEKKWGGKREEKATAVNLLTPVLTPSASPSLPGRREGEQKKGTQGVSSGERE